KAAKTCGHLESDGTCLVLRIGIRHGTAHQLQHFPAFHSTPKLRNRFRKSNPDSPTRIPPAALPRTRRHRDGNRHSPAGRGVCKYVHSRKSYKYSTSHVQG